MGEQEIRCTVQVPRLPSTCGRPAVAIVRYGREAELAEVPYGCIWTGHAVCDLHDRGRYRVHRERSVSTLHEAITYRTTR